MKIIKKLFVMITIIGLLSVPGLAGSFDSEHGTFKEFEGREYVDVSTTFTRVQVFGTAQGLYPDWTEEGKLIYRRASGVFAQEGSGWYMGKGYWVTNAHVVKPSFVVVQIGKGISYVVEPIVIIQAVVTIGQNTDFGSVPAYVVYINEEIDIALLRVDGYWPAAEDLGYRVERTYRGEDLLKEGTPIAILVAKRTSDGSKTGEFEIRYGKIVAPKPILPGEAPSDWLPWFCLNDVTMDITLYSGDSGSPVFAFIDGEPVIIGVARAGANYYEEFYTYFTRIDHIIKFYLEG